MRPSKAILTLTLIVSAIVGVSAIGVGVTALLQPRASWVMFGFEVVILVAATLGVLLARGRFGDGPALGLVSIAATIFIGSVFGYLGGGRTLFSVDLKPLLLARLVAALLLAAAAGWIVLSRDWKATLPPFIRGCAFGLPIPALLFVLWKFRATLGGLSDALQLGLAIVVFSLITGLLAASVQFLIKAFDIGTRRADAATT